MDIRSEMRSMKSTDKNSLSLVGVPELDRVETTSLIHKQINFKHTKMEGKGKDEDYSKHSSRLSLKFGTQSTPRLSSPKFGTIQVKNEIHRGKSKINLSINN